MRGYVEESEEVKAARVLRIAARRYAAVHLSPDTLDAGEESAEAGLRAAALRYAATQPRPKRVTPRDSTQRMGK
jgi:hypothetical protein